MAVRLAERFMRKWNISFCLWDCRNRTFFLRYITYAHDTLACRIEVMAGRLWRIGGTFAYLAEPRNLRKCKGNRPCEFTLFGFSG
jgi:hypothetical protein